jgi:hypothetical protein
VTRDPAQVKTNQNGMIYKIVTTYIQI